jgi:hypothetical protein
LQKSIQARAGSKPNLSTEPLERGGEIRLGRHQHSLRDFQPGCFPALERFELVLTDCNRLVIRQEHTRAEFAMMARQHLDLLVGLAVDQLCAGIAHEGPHDAEVVGIVSRRHEISLVRLSALKRVLIAVDAD